jgi:hypothetical protein
MGKSKPQGKKYDWEALKREWLQSSNVTLNQFRLSKGIAQAHFYRTINAEEWIETRAKIDKRAIQRIEEKAVNSIVNKWDDYSRLWKAVKAQAAAILNKTRQKDGTIVPMRPTDLVNLTNSIETALKSERLIHGESTENIEERITKEEIQGFIFAEIRKNGSNSGVYDIPERAVLRQDLAFEQSIQDTLKNGHSEIQIEPPPNQNNGRLPGDETDPAHHPKE